MESKKSTPVRSWQIVFPNDANPRGTMFGGKLMSIMDIAAGIAASRYSEKMVVTASTEAIIFKRPVQIGDRIESVAKVVWTGRTSMVVKVDVYAENPLDNRREHCTTAHFNFVALDTRNRPCRIPPILVETEKERLEWGIAEKEKQQALRRKNEI